MEKKKVRRLQDCDGRTGGPGGDCVQPSGGSCQKCVQVKRAVVVSDMCVPNQGASWRQGQEFLASVIVVLIVS